MKLTISNNKEILIIFNAKGCHQITRKDIMSKRLFDKNGR